jgi:hypothetical protein
MKLILKRIEKTVEVSALSDSEPRHVAVGLPGTFALHTEDGEMLPCQVSTRMDSSGRGHPVTLTVTFTVDGDKLKVQGDV